MSVEVEAVLPKKYEAETSVVVPQGSGAGGGVPRDEFDLLEQKVDSEIERAKKAEEELGERIDNIKVPDVPEVDLSDYYTKEEVDAELEKKQDTIADLETIRSGAEKGATAVQSDELASVATSGSYDDLKNKPTIPKAVTEETVSGWGFTKNTGTYTMPADGIPASDLSQEVQDALSNAGDILVVEQTEATATIAPNVLNIWGEVATLDITLGEPKEGVINEYMFQFTSGEVATTLILPSEIKWASTPTIQANKVYQISIVNNLAVMGEFSDE